MGSDEQIDSEQIDRLIVALRFVSAKLREARILAEDLSPRTQQVLDEALEHIEYELALLEQSNWNTGEGGGGVTAEEGQQPWWRRWFGG